MSSPQQPRRPDHDITLALPRHWVTRHRPTGGVLVVSRARAVPASGFRPELVVEVEPVDDDLAAWRDGAAEALRTQWERVDVEDDDVYDLNGRTVAYRRFTHVLGVADVVCEQWAWLVDGVGITLTCSVAREDYLDYADVFEQVADTLDVVAHAAA